MGERIAIIILDLGIILFIPYIITLLMNGTNISKKSKLDNVCSGRDVVIVGEEKNELIDVEKYIVGVLPTLIDYNSNPDLIEAQASVIRDRIYYVMGEKTVVWAGDLEYEYKSEEELKSELKGEYERARGVYEQAVLDSFLKN